MSSNAKPITKPITKPKTAKPAAEPKVAKAAAEPKAVKKPTKMSAELCTFFDMPAGSLMARTDATKGITKYVKEHTLQRPDNKRFIEVHRDTKLKKLLKVADDVELSFFNLQTYMTKHFAKKGDDAFVDAYP